MHCALYIVGGCVCFTLCLDCLLALMWGLICDCCLLFDWLYWCGCFYVVLLDCLVFVCLALTMLLLLSLLGNCLLVWCFLFRLVLVFWIDGLLVNSVVIVEECLHVYDLLFICLLFNSLGILLSLIVVGVMFGCLVVDLLFGYLLCLGLRYCVVIVV